MTASTSPLTLLDRLQRVHSVPASRIFLRVSFSISEEAANPASMMSTPRSSRAMAMRTLSSELRAMPGACSPSLRVVSKIWILSLWGRGLSASWLEGLTANMSLRLAFPLVWVDSI